MGGGHGCTGIFLPVLLASLASHGVGGRLPSLFTVVGAPVTRVTDCGPHRLLRNLCLRGGVKAVGHVAPVQNKAANAARRANGDSAGGKDETGNRRKKNAPGGSDAGAVKKKTVRGKAGFRASMHHSKMQYLAPRGRNIAGKKSSRDARDARRSAAGAQVCQESLTSLSPPGGKRPCCTP